MTYVALACLKILGALSERAPILPGVRCTGRYASGDDLARVDRTAVLDKLRALQQPNGSYVTAARCRRR
jgi:hypothetical protein